MSDLEGFVIYACYIVLVGVGIACAIAALWLVFT